MKKLINRLRDWEHWPFTILYAPISVVWVWYMIRSGSVWFFTPSNPKLTFGGMEGEPKKEMYDLLPKDIYPKTCNVLPGEPIELVQKRFQNYGLQFPVIVKPEVGGQGILLRKVDSIEALQNYHKIIPVEYIIQELIVYEMEVSVFYYRYPDSQKGNITGFLHKIPLQVTGDGMTTLKQLIQRHPKAAKRLEELQIVHGMNFEHIPANNENYTLSYAANHNRGAHFIDLSWEIDGQLVNLFDKLSNHVDDFFYGRYDIMCSSVSDLRQGQNFSILEYNGCGAEPNHFYDTGYTLISAYKEILKHWKILFEISMINNKKGIKYWEFLRGLKFLKNTKKHYRTIKQVDRILGY